MDSEEKQQPPGTVPGLELVLWQNLMPRGGQHEAETVYGGQIIRMIQEAEVWDLQVSLHLRNRDARSTISLASKLVCGGNLLSTDFYNLETIARRIYMNK